MGIILRNILKQSLEFGEVAFDGLAEVLIGAIALSNFVENLLTLRRIETACENVALALTVAVPQFGDGLVINASGKIERHNHSV
jgi:hypothetical protein